MKRLPPLLRRKGLERIFVCGDGEEASEFGRWVSLFLHLPDGSGCRTAGLSVNRKLQLLPRERIGKSGVLFRNRAITFTFELAAE